MSTRLLVAIGAGIVVLVAVLAALTGGGDDGGLGGKVASPPATSTPQSPPGGGNGKPPAGCKVPTSAVLERIAGRATDLIDFTPARSAAAPGGGAAVSAPVRPATAGAAVATWLVTAPAVIPANADARDQSSFPPKPVPAAARAAIARSQACVRAGLPPPPSP
jgi:hypothetical protein